MNMKPKRKIRQTKKECTSTTDMHNLEVFLTFWITFGTKEKNYYMKTLSL